MAEDDEITYPVYDGPCKKIHHEPYYTPNNYDLYFDYDSIPANIQPIDAANLEKRLQKLMPLTKIIHVNMDSDALDKINHLNIHTSLDIYEKVTDSKVTLDDSSSYIKITDLDMEEFIVGYKFENNQFIAIKMSLSDITSLRDLLDVILDIKYENGVLSLVKFEPTGDDLDSDKITAADLAILEHALIDIKLENGMLIGVRRD